MESAGFAVGVIALAGLFNSTVECFEYVQAGRKYGKAFQTNVLRIDMARLKLTRWGESIGIADLNEAQSLGQSRISPRDIVQAERILGQILQVFADAEVVSKRAAQDSTIAQEDVTHLNADTSASTLHQKMRNLSLKRQGDAGLREKVKWALYKEKHLTKMVEDISALVDSLVDLFPAAKGVEPELSAAEVSQLSTNNDSPSLCTTAERRDKALREAIAKGRGSSIQIKPCSIVPFPRDPHFVDRGDILDRLHLLCSQPAGRVALTGLGGVGKSQLAIEYAYRLHESSPQTWVFWIHGSTAARFEEAFRLIADRIGLITTENREANVLELLSRWLENEQNGRWTMIVDNADDMGVFFDAKIPAGTIVPSLESKPLSAYLPQSHHGHILFTSRNEELTSRLIGDYHSIFKLGPMNPEEAISLFHKKRTQEDDRQEVIELLLVLEHIALAISQAAAFINRAGSRGSIRRYLQLYHGSEQSRNSLLNFDGGDLRRDSSAHNSIVITWQVSFERIAQERPSAADLLSLMSFFHWQNIPEFALRKAAWHKPQQDGLDKGFEFEEDITHLQSYGLITCLPENESFEMHRLVKMSMQLWLTTKEYYKKWTTTFFDIMARVFPDGEYETWPTCQVLFPHVIAAGDKSPDVAAATEHWEYMLQKAATYANRIGQQGIAEEMARKSFESRKQRVGEEMLLIDDIFDDLGFILSNRGKYEESESMHRRALERREQVLGSGDLSTLKSMHNLALVLSNQGKYEEAESILRRVVQQREIVLGYEQQYTLSSTNNLACTLARQEKYEEAELMHTLVLARQKIVLGPQHPHTLTSIYNLAVILRCQEKYQESESMLKEVVQLSEVVLGSEHPDTLNYKSSLANVLCAQGKCKETESLHQRVLLSLETGLGFEHPNTLFSVWSLAVCLRKQKLYDEALILYERAYEGFNSVLGMDHPHSRKCSKSYSKLLEFLLQQESASTLGNQVLAETIPTGEGSEPSDGGSRITVNDSMLAKEAQETERDGD